MATGAEHYAETEKLLRDAGRVNLGDEATYHLLAAQAHAILALADHVASLVDRLGEVSR